MFSNKMEGQIVVCSVLHSSMHYVVEKWASLTLTSPKWGLILSFASAMKSYCPFLLLQRSHSVFAEGKHLRSLFTAHARCPKAWMTWSSAKSALPGTIFHVWGGMVERGSLSSVVIVRSNYHILCAQSVSCRFFLLLVCVVQYLLLRILNTIAI